MPQLPQGPGFELADAFARYCERLPDRLQVLRTTSRYEVKCGATMPMNSRDVIPLICFQNSGKCRRLPVMR